MDTTTATIPAYLYDLPAKRVARQAASVHATMPVEVVHGDAAPTVKGRSWYYTTPSGAPVRYPNAYRRAYGRPVYHHSTARVVVGAEWLAAALSERRAA